MGPNSSRKFPGQSRIHAEVSQLLVPLSLPHHTLPSALPFPNSTSFLVGCSDKGVVCRVGSFLSTFCTVEAVVLYTESQVWTHAILPLLTDDCLHSLGPPHSPSGGDGEVETCHHVLAMLSPPPTLDK